ncbi:hypothetical protein SprV_0200956400 [Sparganum proliferum]
MKIQSRYYTDATCWYHTAFDAKARRCIYPCSFTTKQGKRLKQVSPEVSTANLPGSSNPSCTFYARDTRIGRRFLIDAGTKLSVILPTQLIVGVPIPASSFRPSTRRPLPPSEPAPVLWKSASDVFSPGSSSLLTSPLPFSAQNSSSFSIFWSTVVSPVNTTRPTNSPSGVSLLLTLPVSSPSWLQNPRIHLATPRQIHWPHSSQLQRFYSATRRCSPHPDHWSSRPRRLASPRLSAAEAEFEHMLQMGNLKAHGPRPSTWSQRPLWRPCGDYRALNNVTVPDHYPVPHLQDFSSILFDKSMFSKIDLVCAFHQIPIALADVLKTAVITSSGLFEFLRMSFGLRKASQTCWRHLVDSNDIQSLPSKVVAIRDFKPAASKRQLQRLLGMDLAIETIELLLQSKYDETENRLVIAQILHLLRLCLRTYFTFDGTIYKQVKGTPMGSAISGFIAEAVLQRLDSLVSQHHKPKFWARYVDDTFVVIERDQGLTFQEHLNAVFSDIQFTMEEEENNQLAFLDVLLCRKDCGGLKARVFRKATNTMQVLDFNSNHPISHKRSCVRTLYRRVETHCSGPEDKIAELQYLRRVFKANGYPRNFVNRCIRKRDERSNHTNTKSWRAFPYVKNVSEAVGRLLPPLVVGVARRPEATIRRLALKPKDPLPRLETSGVVYRIWCSCGQSNCVG